MRYTKRASLWAPALMAVGAPRRDLMRRIKAPMAVLLCIALCAAKHSRRRAIGIFARFTRKDFASANAIVRSNIEPSAKVLFAGPTAHIETDFGENPFDCQQVQPG